MHGQNSKENQDKLVDYYNKYVDRQKRIGVNARHESIAAKLVQSGLKNGVSLLEIGCGIGTFSSLLPQINGTGTNFCIDISDESIKLARETFKKETSLRFECANAVEYDFNQQKFDVVVLPDVIEHIPQEFHKKLFESLAKVLKEQGFIFIHIPNPEYLAWCHENRPDLLQIIDQPIYTSELLKSISGTDLHIHELKTYSIWVVDGDYQYIVLKKNGFQNFENTREEKVTFWDKIKYKLNVKK